MAKRTTTKATYRGIVITVMSENNGRRAKYSCNNDSKQSKTNVTWFETQGEAIANERIEIDAVLQ